ncbi:hypothetical protein ACVIW2_007403 [Bradyrhizobium huanghuaihaiense]|uniref:Uncharacterized protein n=1 Tax=Bradyrhizobium huanghuaihaiense TaxID=990078 RepID=A0A562RUR1_9BRAD|nr:hypothetical protein [Bradyrhizobium huanghuaihaiense]TWI72802.1 hypothetical protein IQ16_02380 [Bradyrhizobium huanghuaihaiense]
MSGHLRLCQASLVLVGVLAAQPAFSDPLADLFNSPAREPAATAPAQAECLSRPGNSAGADQHWVYRRDQGRRCWFLTEHVSTVKKPAHRRVAHRRANPVENETAPPRRRISVVDARAELARSAPAEGVEPPQPPRKVKVADAAFVVDTSTTPLMSAAAATPAPLPAGQLTPENAVPAIGDVQKLGAPASDAASIQVPPVSIRVAEAADEGGWMATWVGLLLMALGIGSVLSSSRALRDIVLLRH